MSVDGFFTMSDENDWDDETAEEQGNTDDTGDSGGNNFRGDE